MSNDLTPNSNPLHLYMKNHPVLNDYTPQKYFKEQNCVNSKKFILRPKKALTAPTLLAEFGKIRTKCSF